MLLFFINFSCRKIELQAPVPEAPITANTDTTVNNFFKLFENTDPVVTGIRNNILRQQSQKPFVDKFVNYAGYPVWDKAVIKNALENTSSTRVAERGENTSKVIFIPLAPANDSIIKSILKVKIEGSDTSFKMLYRWQYNEHGYKKNKKFNNADQVALMFMGLESYTFGHKDFKINDTLLLKDSRLKERIHISSFNKNTSDKTMRLQLVKVTICYQVSCFPDNRAEKTTSTIYCENCADFDVWEDDGFGGGGGGGEGGPGGGDGNNGGGGGWQDDPCAPTNPTRNTVSMKLAPCDGGDDEEAPWLPDAPPLLPEDGYQLTADDIRIFNQLAAEDMEADDNYYNKDCKGTLRGGNHKWPGTMAHWIIQVDYICNNVTSGEIEYAIPGSSAAGNRGYADMVNLQSNEIFEIKKYDDIGNGVTEVERYVNGAKANCPVAAGSSTPTWRKGANYTAKTLPTNTPGTYLQVALAAPGVISYKYINDANPVPSPITVPTSALDKLKTLVNKIKQHVDDADKILAQYMRENPELVNYLKGAAYTSAIAIVVGTIAEDILSGGAGVLDDWASFSLAYRIVRFAWAL